MRCQIFHRRSLYYHDRTEVDLKIVRLLVKNTNKGDALRLSMIFKNAGQGGQNFIDTLTGFSMFPSSESVQSQPLLVFFTNKPT